MLASQVREQSLISLAKAPDRRRWSRTESGQNAFCSSASQRGREVALERNGLGFLSGGGKKRVRTPESILGVGTLRLFWVRHSHKGHSFMCQKKSQTGRVNWVEPRNQVSLQGHSGEEPSAAGNPLQLPPPSRGRIPPFPRTPSRFPSVKGSDWSNRPFSPKWFVYQRWFWVLPQGKLFSLFKFE